MKYDLKYYLDNSEIKLGDIFFEHCVAGYIIYQVMFGHYSNWDGENNDYGYGFYLEVVSNTIDDNIFNRDTKSIYEVAINPNWGYRPNKKLERKLIEIKNDR